MAMLNPFVFLWEATKISGKQENEVIHRKGRIITRPELSIKLKGGVELDLHEPLLCKEFMYRGLDNEEKGKSRIPFQL